VLPFTWLALFASTGHLLESLQLVPRGMIKPFCMERRRVSQFLKEKALEDTPKKH
jgi:hypothetical protein